MRNVAIAASVLLIALAALLIFRGPHEDSGFGPPLRLAAGKPPPLPKAGSLASPRSLEQVGLPRQLTASITPASNPTTPAAVALGKKLFFESRLSDDGTVSCASCHNPARAFTDGRPASVGIKGCVGERNAPTILNAMYNKFQFWDGRAGSLEQQAAFPVTNPCEMGSTTVAAATSRIAGDRGYQEAFTSAYRRGPNQQDLLNSLAAYERSLTSFNSPFDRFIAGDRKAIDPSAQRGWSLFNSKARCHLCHAVTDTKPDAALMTDNDFHNIGIGIIRHNVVALAQKAQREIASGHLQQVDTAAINSELSVLGRFLLTKSTPDTAAFKTPGLRNVMVTAPYFHDGSQQTLWDVVDHYNKGDGIKNPWLDADMQPLALTEPEIDDLVAFMASLTSPEYQSLADRDLARQRAIANHSRPQRDTRRAFAPKVRQPPIPSS